MTCTKCARAATHGVRPDPTGEKPHPFVEPRCDDHGAPRRVPRSIDVGLLLLFTRQEVAHG